MSERERRIAENEAIFRSVNERVEALHATLATVTDPLHVVCECGTRSCTERISIPTKAYSEVREDPTLFVTKPGHDFPETESVASKHERYWVVRKHPGLPAAIARATAP